MKFSHYVCGGMLVASSTGVGSIVAGVWFIADLDGDGVINPTTEIIDETELVRFAETKT